MANGRTSLGVVAVTLLLSWPLTGCSDSSEKGTVPSSSHPSETPSPADPPESPDDPGTTAAVRTDPLAPTPLPPVIRDGTTPHPSISAQPQPFDEAVTYPDGVSLEVTSLDQGEVTDRGPGVITGPTTAFELRFTNGGSRAIDLSTVTVTTVYGDPARTSRPVYDERSRDFSGRVRPGATAEARYVFSIPTDQLGDVTVHVDFDGLHAAGRFTGDAA